MGFKLQGRSVTLENCFTSLRISGFFRVVIVHPHLYCFKLCLALGPSFASDADLLGAGPHSGKLLRCGSCSQRSWHHGVSHRLPEPVSSVKGKYMTGSSPRSPLAPRFWNLHNQQEEWDFVFLVTRRQCLFLGLRTRARLSDPTWAPVTPMCGTEASEEVHCMLCV